MNKIQASILVIGYQKEDDRMYPHLHDFLFNLRGTYEDVIYAGSDDRGVALFHSDLYMRKILDLFYFHKWFINRRNKIKEKNINVNKSSNRNRIVSKKLNIKHFLKVGKCFMRNRFTILFANVVIYFWRSNKLLRFLKNVQFKYDRRIVIAIDHTAYYFAEKCFPDKVVLWSYDIIAKDANNRIKNGFLEKVVTSKGNRNARALIIQDEQRKQLMEESVGASFSKTIYLPVSLNDSEFCKNAANDRQKKTNFDVVNIIQDGAIQKIRYSDQIIDAFQKWPVSYKLHLHGMIDQEVKNQILLSERKPTTSELMYDSDRLILFFNDYDIGFVGYARKNSNQNLIENASGQIVEFLRLGIPVIVCGSSLFNDFINRQNVGVGVSSISEVEDAIKTVVDNYSSFSYNARKLYEIRYNLTVIFNDYLIKSFESLF